MLAQAEIKQTMNRPKATQHWLVHFLTHFIHNKQALLTLITLVTMLLGWFFMNNAPIPSIICFIIAYLAGGYYGLIGSVETLRERKIDIDLLMILAAVGAAVVNQPFEGALLLFLFSLSNVLQEYALDRTRNAIEALMELRPNTAVIERNGDWVVLPVEEAKIGDHFVIKPGERIALDGVVAAGQSSVDQASITGESIPVFKSVGETIFAGTINQQGHLEAKVTQLAQDSTLARLIAMVEQAQNDKAKTERWIDRAEQYYAITVILFTILMIVVPFFLLNEPFNTAFYRAMTVLVAASPCALVISTPATVLSAIGNGARRGILFKGGAYVEDAAKLDVMVFDKTGTLTQGKPQVTDILSFDPMFTNDTILRLAASVEAKSEHPLAQAVVQKAQSLGLAVGDSADFSAMVGKGVQATVDGRRLTIAAPRYYENNALQSDWQTSIKQLQLQGKTTVILSEERAGETVILGALAIADVVRPVAKEAIRQLKEAGIKKVVMLTGDHPDVAQAIASQVGIDEYYADLLPQDKVTILKQLLAKGYHVGMVGDGVNDAPALATATMGIAMGAAGSDVALESADIVLMSDDLMRLPYMVRLSHATRRTLITNLSIAFAAIVIMLITIFAFSLPLPFAVIGHEGGTVLVSLNGLRLLAYK